MPPGSPTPETGTQTFEVRRFAWTAPDRLELEGRWTGVRGVRFVRPTLVLAAGDHHHRALALLEHKPWAPADGVPWLAAFPWDGEPLDADAGELTVAPGIVMALPAPDLPPGARRRSDETPPVPSGPRSTAVGQGIVQRADVKLVVLV